MGEISYPDSINYWIAYSDDGLVFTYGSTKQNQVTTTGQSHFETFTDRQAWIDRIEALGHQYVEVDNGY